MDGDRRGKLAKQALDGYVSGKDAPIAATSAAMLRAESARSLILVEGISDQIAVETLAERKARDLEAEGIVVVPIGGAQAITRCLTEFATSDRARSGSGEARRIVGLCDVGEEQYFRLALSTAGIGSPQDRSGMEELGFFVCVDDLEDELIRAAGETAITNLLDSQGDLGSFRTLQKQPAWRDRAFRDQMRRFLGAGARRKLRYARLLTKAIEPGEVPRPLEGVLAAA